MDIVGDMGQPLDFGGGDEAEEEQEADDGLVGVAPDTVEIELASQLSPSSMNHVGSMMA